MPLIDSKFALVSSRRSTLTHKIKSMAKVRSLPDYLQATAIRELHEVPERIEEDIQALKTWIAQQPHLRARTDDQFLLAFLRGCKYSLEKAKSKIDKYYMLRSKFPNTFHVTNWDDPKVREVMSLGIGTLLPTPLNDNGPRILFIRNGHYPADKFNYEDIMPVIQAVNEIIMMEDDIAVINGIVYVMDFEEVTAQHFLHWTPTIMKKMTVYSEEAVPLRPKAQHCFNTPSAFDAVFNTLKPLIPKKQQDRMFFHGSKMEKLYEHVPKKYLPIEYGGENGSLDEINKEWEKKILSYREFFKENDNYGTDEKLRPGKPIDFESIFGLEGSFRKLNVD